MVIRLLAMVTACVLPDISMTLSLSGSGLRSRDLWPPLAPTSMMLMLAPDRVLISLILAPLFPMTAPMTSFGTFISYLLGKLYMKLCWLACPLRDSLALSLLAVISSSASSSSSSSPSLSPRKVSNRLKRAATKVSHHWTPVPPED